jgi:hypothetical protein
MADAVPLQDGDTHTDSVLVVVVVAVACGTRYYCCCYAIVVGLLAAWNYCSCDGLKLDSYCHVLEVVVVVVVEVVTVLDGVTYKQDCKTAQVSMWWTD